jgi:hypothetical protein
MVENMITNTQGDALSRLIQLQAGRHDIRQTWSGNGVTDLIALCNAHAVKARLSKHLWTCMRELMQMPELKTLPEPIQAQIMSIVLSAQALVELDNESHAKKLAQLDKPKVLA